jgi:surface antigen Omp85-like protein
VYRRQVLRVGDVQLRHLLRLHRSLTSRLAIVLGVLELMMAEARAEPPAAAEGGSARELNFVPLVGGDSDVGLGFGEVGDWARLEPNAGLFRWRLENAAFISFKLRDDGHELIVPFQDYYLLFSRRNAGAEKRWQVDVRVAFTDETTLKFYGFGNATPLPPGSVNTRDAEYGRIHPTLSLQRRGVLGHHLFLQLGSVFTYNRLAVSSTSTLAVAAASGSRFTQGLLGDFRSHGVELLEVGLEYDTRDNEIITRDGSFHALQLRVSPRIGQPLPYAYLQIDGTLRFFATPVPRWLTIAARAVGDVLLGDPPFYELARFDETAAIGGTKAIRGVPAQRYYGKVKVFGNVELRTELTSFHIGTKALVLGTAAFFDAGRVWTELTRAHPELDGSGIQLKYGVGGGLRLQQGETFVVRADLAWSPDARPVGGYFAAGQIF